MPDSGCHLLCKHCDSAVTACFPGCINHADCFAFDNIRSRIKSTFGVSASDSIGGYHLAFSAERALIHPYVERTQHIQIGRDLIPLFEHDDIPAYQLFGQNALINTAAPDRHFQRKNLSERFETSLRTKLLIKPEYAVQDDDDDNRPPDRAHIRSRVKPRRQKTDRGGDPQQQCEKMGKLEKQFELPGTGGKLRQYIRPRFDKSLGRFRAAQPVFRCLQCR